MVEPEEQRRTSQRTKGTHTFRRKYENGMETWEGTEVMGKSSNARYRIDPTIIIAEPTAGVGIGTAILFPDPTSLQPLDASVKTEQLRAYHARLDVINDAFLGTPIRQTGNRACGTLYLSRQWKWI
jgi:hypothetical protein